MVHGKNSIPYRIDRRLTGLAGPKYHAIISFGLPIEPSQYESRKFANKRGWTHWDYLYLLRTGSEAALTSIGRPFGMRF